MTESCPLKKETEKSVEGFYTNLKFPESRRATHSNSTNHVVNSRDILNRENEIKLLLTNMTNVSNEIGSLHKRQRGYREKTGNTILSQNDSMDYTKYDNAVIDGSDTPSYLIKQLQTGGVEECKRSCDTNKNCGGFSYWSGNGTCTMKEISILPNPPIQRYNRSLLGDVWNGQYNAATNQYLTNKGKMTTVNRGGVTSVELTPEEKQRLATTFMDTSDFCDGEKIYVDANSERINQTTGDEGKCATACQDDVNCDMYLMSDANTCNTYRKVSNVSAFCKSGDGHTSWGNLKKKMLGKIIRFPTTDGSEGFSLFSSSTEPVVEGFSWGSFWKDIKKAAAKAVPPPPKCSIKIVGDCPSHSGLANSGWFNDRNHRTSNNDRGNLFTTRDQCSKRRNRWESDCRASSKNVNVYNYYAPSKKNQPSPSGPSPQETWTTYVKDPKTNYQTDPEQRNIQSELDAKVRQYASNVDELKKYNLDLTTMSEGNSETMDKAIAEYRANIAIVAENRENKIWIHDKNIVDITKLTRKSSVYIYMLWGVLAVIMLILLLRNAM